MRELLIFILVTASLSCFSVEKKELRSLLTKAQTVKKLKEPVKQKSALEILKRSFKIVRSHRNDIPGNQAPSIEARLRTIYQDVKKKNYQSFYKAVSEGESTFKVYDSAGNLLDLFK